MTVIESFINSGKCIEIQNDARLYFYLVHFALSCTTMPLWWIRPSLVVGFVHAIRSWICWRLDPSIRLGIQFRYTVVRHAQWTIFSGDGAIGVDIGIITIRFRLWGCKRRNQIFGIIAKRRNTSGQREPIWIYLIVWLNINSESGL